MNCIAHDQPEEPTRTSAERFSLDDYAEAADDLSEVVDDSIAVVTSTTRASTADES